MESDYVCAGTETSPTLQIGELRSWAHGHAAVPNKK
jgi:hypothetical protein